MLHKYLQCRRQYNTLLCPTYTIINSTRPVKIREKNHPFFLSITPFVTLSPSLYIPFHHFFNQSAGQSFCPSKNLSIRPRHGVSDDEDTTAISFLKNPAFLSFKYLDVLLLFKLPTCNPRINFTPVSVSQ
jgi:hypothetical protein